MKKKNKREKLMIGSDGITRKALEYQIPRGCFKPIIDFHTQRAVNCS